MSAAAADGGCSKQAATQDLQAKIPVQATTLIEEFLKSRPYSHFRPVFSLDYSA